MRRRSLPSGLLASLAALALWGAGGKGALAEDSPVAKAVADLDSPAWRTRRGAEGALEAEGVAALLAADAPQEEKDRAAAFWGAVEAGWASRRPAVLAGLSRVLSRMEERADEEQVRAIPRLLRLRIERLLPKAVGRSVPSDNLLGGFRLPRRFRGYGESVEADEVSEASLRALLPEAAPLLLDVLETSRDPKSVAGAVLILSGDPHEGTDDPKVLAAFARLGPEAPERAAAMAPYVSSDHTVPLAHVALALVLSGKAAKAAAILKGAADAAAVAMDLSRRRLPALRQGDLAQSDRFLDAALSGRVDVREATEAAKRALDAGLPWVARIEARRALFLDRDDLAARIALVASAVAAGLPATARAEAGDAVPLPPSLAAADDEKAKALDDLLTAGGFGRRLAWRQDARSTDTPGVVPIAPGKGFVAIGDAVGDVRIVALDTGARLTSGSSTASRLPRAVAASGTWLAAVSQTGNLVVWDFSGEEMRVVTLPKEPRRPGPWALVAAAGDGGTFVLARSDDGRLFTFAPGSEPVPVGPSLGRGPLPTTLAALSDGAFLVVRGRAVLRVEPATNRVTSIAEGDDAGVSGPYGTDVLVARGGVWERRGPDGRVEDSHPDPTGDTILGIAGDPKAGVVYLARADSVTAVTAATGEAIWTEETEASGSPVLAEGTVLVPTGSGRGERGDGQRDRSVTALRTTEQGFDETTRSKAIEAAKSAKKEGSATVSRLLVDVLWDSLPPEERERLKEDLPPLSSPSEADSDR